MDQINLAGYEWRNYWSNAAAHAGLAFGGYALLGGVKLFGSEFRFLADGRAPVPPAPWITLAVILGVIVSVLFLAANIGMAAFAGAVVLAVLASPTTSRRSAGCRGRRS